MASRLVGDAGDECTVPRASIPQRDPALVNPAPCFPEPWEPLNDPTVNHVLSNPGRWTQCVRDETGLSKKGPAGNIGDNFAQIYH